MLCSAATSIATSPAGCIPKCVQVLKPGGHLSHIMNKGTDQEALTQLQEAGGGPTASLTLVTPNGAQLEEVFELIAAGKVKLEVAKVGCEPKDWWLKRRQTRSSRGCALSR